MRETMNASEVRRAKHYIDLGEDIKRISSRMDIDEDVIKKCLGIKPRRKPRKDKGVKRVKKDVKSIDL